MQLQNSKGSEVTDFPKPYVAARPDRHLMSKPERGLLDRMVMYLHRGKRPSASADHLRFMGSFEQSNLIPKRVAALVVSYLFFIFAVSLFVFGVTNVWVWPPEDQQVGWAQYVQSNAVVINHLVSRTSELNMGLLWGMLGAYTTVIVAVLFLNKLNQDELTYKNFQGLQFSKNWPQGRPIRYISAALTAFEGTIVLCSIHLIMTQLVMGVRSGWQGFSFVDAGLAVVVAGVAICLHAAVTEGDFGLQSRLWAEVDRHENIRNKMVRIAATDCPAPWAGRTNRRAHIKLRGRVGNEEAGAAEVGELGGPRTRWSWWLRGEVFAAGIVFLVLLATTHVFTALGWLGALLLWKSLIVVQVVISPFWLRLDRYVSNFVAGTIGFALLIIVFQIFLHGLRARISISSGVDSSHWYDSDYLVYGYMIAFSVTSAACLISAFLRVHLGAREAKTLKSSGYQELDRNRQRSIRKIQNLVLHLS